MTVHNNTVMPVHNTVMPVNNTVCSGLIYVVMYAYKINVRIRCRLCILSTTEQWQWMYCCSSFLWWKWLSPYGQRSYAVALYVAVLQVWSVSNNIVSTLYNQWRLYDYKRLNIALMMAI